MSNDPHPDEHSLPSNPQCFGLMRQGDGFSGELPLGYSMTITTIHYHGQHSYAAGFGQPRAPVPPFPSAATRMSPTKTSFTGHRFYRAQTNFSGDSESFYGIEGPCGRPFAKLGLSIATGTWTLPSGSGNDLPLFAAVHESTIGREVPMANYLRVDNDAVLGQKFDALEPLFIPASTSLSALHFFYAIRHYASNRFIRIHPGFSGIYDPKGHWETLEEEQKWQQHRVLIMECLVEINTLAKVSDKFPAVDELTRAVEILLDEGPRDDCPPVCLGLVIAMLLSDGS
ncbi:Uu.00g102730.m01.CDS01 [Anthostomella pinea]|uniref:Uu.00g102730.m01.CDS01 n=1 Tax=Anthostomella pinea TaxID=933095 RepID=A0AAI8YFN6_9PEZI|nr:Uu.00g102730.m01.CDS01 [Anthostomella pinea]